MDSRIDLTTNRDFRHRRVDPSVPRSIFSKDEGRLTSAMTSFTITNQFGIIDQTGGTWMSTNGNILTTTNATNYIGYQLREGTCSYCGKDISRLPWNKESHHGLCRACDTRFSQKKKRIPWK